MFDLTGWLFSGRSKGLQQFMSSFHLVEFHEVVVMFFEALRQFGRNLLS